MLDFGSFPIERQMLLSAQFLHKELPVRLAHRVAELENLPFGLSEKRQVQTVRDWYVESFRELRGFREVRNATEEEAFTRLIKAIMTARRNTCGLLSLSLPLKKKKKNAPLLSPSLSRSLSLSLSLYPPLTLSPLAVPRVRMLMRLRAQRHNNVVPMIARGVHELRSEHSYDLGALPEIHQFLDGFYMSRSAPFFSRNGGTEQTQPREANERA